MTRATSPDTAEDRVECCTIRDEHTEPRVRVLHLAVFGIIQRFFGTIR
jgi:hypothetical protein